MQENLLFLLHVSKSRIHTFTDQICNQEQSSFSVLVATISGTRFIQHVV